MSHTHAGNARAWVLLLLFTVHSALFTVHSAYAADAALYLSPVTGTVAVGEEFPVRVMVQTGDHVVNAVEGKLTFDPSELSVSGLSDTNSMITSWTSPPAFDNKKGEITWSGFTATGTVPGRGLVFAITLRSLRATEAKLRFSSGAAVLAADGAGTNILTSMNGGIYVGVPLESLPATPGEAPDTKTPTERATAGEASVPSSEDGEVLGAATGTALFAIESSTHPDPNGWYNLRDVTLAWATSTDVVAVRTSLDHLEKGNPLREYRPAIFTKTVEDVDDGVWYFHLAREFADGTVESVHRRVGIDTATPTGFVAALAARESASDPRVSFTVTATDTLSGIDRFTFALDGGPATDWRDDGGGIYAPKDTFAPGSHVMHVSVFDRAGNTASSDVAFAVEFLPSPTLALVDPEPKEGGHLQARGDASPNAVVKIALSRGEETPVIQEVRADASGKFVYESAIPLLPGNYAYWVSSVDARGAQSTESAHETVVVTPTLLGILKRHPFIPVAGISLLLLVGASWYLVRRMRGTPEMKEDDERAHDDARVVGGERARVTYAKDSGPVVTTKGVSTYGGVVRLKSLSR